MKEPENMPGLVRALRLIEHQKKCFAWNEIVKAALDRVELSIRAEIENGGRMTSVAMYEEGAVHGVEGGEGA